LDKVFEKRLRLFLADPKQSILKDHGLTGTLKGLRAFSLGGDMRVIYRKTKSVVELFDIGSHNQVY
jgi:addiction module RelE/StbE family toxin